MIDGTWYANPKQLQSLTLNNSIAAETSPESIANEVRLLRSSTDFVIFLFEGNTDLRLFRKLLKLTPDSVLDGKGKENVVQAIEILDHCETTNGYLAIVDADFDRIIDCLEVSENIIHTDTHDVETLIVSSSAFAAVTEELGSTEKCNRFEEEECCHIAEGLAERAKWIGYLRLHAIENSIPIRFEGMNYNFVDRDLLLDRARLVRHLISHSMPEIGDTNRTNGIRITDQLLQDCLDDIDARELDRWQLCHGHDIVNILAIGLRHKLGSRNAQETKATLLEKVLRLAFHKDHFAQTKMYENLRHWCDQNPGYALPALTP